MTYGFIFWVYIPPVFHLRFPSSVSKTIIRGCARNRFENATAKNLLATFDCALTDRVKFQPKAEVRVAIFDLVEGYCNPWYYLINSV
jgi:hypothetical protein